MAKNDNFLVACKKERKHTEKKNIFYIFLYTIIIKIIIKIAL